MEEKNVATWEEYLEGWTKFGRNAPVLRTMCRIILCCFAVKEARAGGLVRLSNGRGSECSIGTITESSPKSDHRLRAWWAVIGPFLRTQNLSVWSRRTKNSTTSCGQEIAPLMRTWPTCDITVFPPLLDWSRSPYVAAYFAFANAGKDTNGSVSIFVLCERNFKVSGNRMDVIHIFGPYVKTHRRHVLQQSQYTVCLSFHDEWRFESYDLVFEEGPRQQAFCWKFTIPVSERSKVLALLDEHNLNAFSLFGSEESLMETLATREFR